MRKGYVNTVIKMMASILLQTWSLVLLYHDFYLAAAGMIIFDIVYLYVVMLVTVKGELENRTCKKCGTVFSRKLRICPACGQPYGAADREHEFAVILENENEKETEKTPEEINRDFERIEEMNVEAAFALDESGIDEILREKQKRDDGE